MGAWLGSLYHKIHYIEVCYIEVWDTALPLKKGGGIFYRQKSMIW